MIRIIAFLGGAVFVAALLVALLMPRETVEHSASHVFHKHPKQVSFASDGPAGKFDRQQLQRGFQVYKEVCAACHSLRLVAFNDLRQLGYSEGEVKKIASDWVIETPTVNPQTGEPAMRKSIAADKFPSPFANEVAARAANNNALPPDFSLITKAREGGAAYVYSLLTGYQAPPEQLKKEFPDAMPGANLHYNPYFANLNISMPPPITSDGQVTYADGTKATKDQMAKDVSAFLVWTAEPKLEARHRAGWASILFLFIFAGLCWMSYKSVWADKKH
jgi:ubiquinol-cytochrome c reductase cytochrome c1 subunit